MGNIMVQAGSDLGVYPANFNKYYLIAYGINGETMDLDPNNTYDYVTKNCIAWLAWLSRRFARVRSFFILGSYVSVSKSGIFCNLSIIRLFRKF